MTRRVLALSAMLCAALGTGPAAWSARFEVIYADSAGEGFYDPVLGAGRQEAFGRALEAWSVRLQSDVTIRVRASFDPLGGSASSAPLGQAQLTWLMSNFSGAPQADTWYVSSLADALAGTDLKPKEADFVVCFNSDVDGAVLGAKDWHYGQDVPTNGDVDFQTVAMHELCHGLGFLSSFRGNGTWGYYGLPTVFDTFLVNAAGRRLIDLPVSVANVTAATYFAGPNATEAYHAADGAGAVKLFAPSSWRTGSSLSHLDEATFRNEAGLMSPYYDTGLRMIDAVVLGVLRDLGWAVHDPTAIPEPSAAAVLLAGAFLLRRRRSGRRRRAL